MKVFLDQQSLGLRMYLEAVGIDVVTDAEIRGNNDTSEGVPDDKIREYLGAHPELILVTKDKHFKRKALAPDSKIVFVDESEAVAVEALRRLARMK